MVVVAVLVGGDDVGRSPTRTHKCKHRHGHTFASNARSISCTLTTPCVSHNAMAAITSLLSDATASLSASTLDLAMPSLLDAFVLRLFSHAAVSALVVPSFTASSSRKVTHTSIGAVRRQSCLKRWSERERKRG